MVFVSGCGSSQVQSLQANTVRFLFLSHIAPPPAGPLTAKRGRTTRRHPRSAASTLGWSRRSGERRAGAVCRRGVRQATSEATSSNQRNFASGRASLDRPHQLQKSQKFFDRVNHDVLMGRLERRIADKRLLRVIRRFLEAGIMANGVVVERYEGTPQGGPLSPLLANVLLDEVDKELEARGLCFARYADDCNVYVASKRAGEDVMATLKEQYERLHLKLNESKSAVARPQEGSSWGTASGTAQERGPASGGAQGPREAEGARPGDHFPEQRTKRHGGHRGAAILPGGWKAYFRLAQTPGVLADLDGWIRRKLRVLQLVQWKRGTTAYRELRKLGAGEDVAARVAKNLRRWWRNSGMLLNTVLNTRYYDRLGLPRLSC